MEKRWGNNGSCYKNQPVWEAIQTFGWNNIKHNILFDHLSINQAQQLEKEMIQKYDSLNNGYNCTSGGDHYFEIEVDGKNLSAYDIAQLSPYAISGHDVTNRINEHGWSLDKTINTPLQDKGHLYLLDNQWVSLRELYERRVNKELTYRQIASRIIRHKWDPKRAISQPTNVKKQPFGIGEKKYDYHGKLYSSYELSQIHPELGLTSFDITNRINHHGWDIDKAVSQPKRKRS